MTPPRLLGLDMGRENDHLEPACHQSNHVDPNTIRSSWAPQRGKAPAMCFESLEGRTQPRTTYDSTKSPGARQLSTIVVEEYRWRRWKRKKGGMVIVWGWRQIWRNEGIEELAVMDTGV